MPWYFIPRVLKLAKLANIIIIFIIFISIIIILTILRPVLCPRKSGGAFRKISLPSKSYRVNVTVT